MKNKDETTDPSSVFTRIVKLSNSTNNLTMTTNLYWECYSDLKKKHSKYYTKNGKFRDEKEVNEYLKEKYVYSEIRLKKKLKYMIVKLVNRTVKKDILLGSNQKTMELDFDILNMSLTKKELTTIQKWCTIIQTGGEFEVINVYALRYESGMYPEGFYLEMLYRRIADKFYEDGVVKEYGL